MTQPAASTPDLPPAATRLAFLEGLRGLAAMQVLLLHYFAMMLPYAARADAVRHIDAESWIADTPLFFLINGHLAVQLFFLISGCVLAASFMRSRACVPALILKRFLRLLLPALAAIVVAVALLAWLPMERAAMTELVKSDWVTRYMNTPLQLAAVARDALLDGILLGYQDVSLFEGVGMGKQPWMSSIGGAAVPPLWTLHVEFWGSMLVLLLAAAHRRLLGGRGGSGSTAPRAPLNSTLNTCAFALVVAGALVLTGSSAYSLFVVGFLLTWRGALHLPPGPPGPAAPGLPMTPLLVFGILLATLPALPGMATLLRLVDSVSVLRAQNADMLQSQLGAVLIFVSVIRSPLLRRCLSVAPLVHLGRLSFSIYLLHFAVMALIGSRIFLGLAPAGYLAAGVVTLVAGAAITFLLALGFEKFVDRPSVALAARLSANATPRA